MQAAVLDRPQTEPAVSLPLDLPSSILYPDFDFSVPAPASDALPGGSPTPWPRPSPSIR